MESIVDLFRHAVSQTLVSLSHNWPYLLAGILTAAALKAFLKSDRVSAFLLRFRGAGVVAATAAAVTTPFCSCGTTAVVLGMMAGAMPLAPVVAFMVASPLSSPGELVYSAGLFGWPFAIWVFASSILLGLGGGGVAAVLESRGWLKGQTRFTIAGTPSAVPVGRAAVRSPIRNRIRKPIPASAAACACAAGPALPSDASAGPYRDASSACGCAPAATAPSPRPDLLVSRTLEFLRAAAEVSRALVPMFLGFAFLGYLLNGLIPASWISALFGEGRVYGVPLAATLGLPLYVNSEASLPLVRAFLDSGMTRGAVMAFLIAGSGTSVGAITGALTIARWRVVGLVTAVLWIGAILAGWGFDLAAAAGWI